MRTSAAKQCEKSQPNAFRHRCRVSQISFALRPHAGGGVRHVPRIRRFGGIYNLIDKFRYVSLAKRVGIPFGRAAGDSGRGGSSRVAGSITASLDAFRHFNSSNFLEETIFHPYVSLSECPLLCARTALRRSRESRFSSRGRLATPRGRRGLQHALKSHF